MKLAAPLLFGLVLIAPAAADDLAPVALNSLTAAPAKIAAAPVLNQNGTIIGKVRAVVTDQDGRPSALSYVASADNRLRVVAAPAVSYDGQNNFVVADTSGQVVTQQVAVN